VKAKHLPTVIIAAMMLVAITCVINVFIRQNRQWELSRAAQDGDLSAVKRCVAAGVTIDATPDDGANFGEPALIAAAWGSHDDVILFLLDHGASINRRDSCGNTALNAAAIRGHTSTAQLLLSRGADPNIRGEGSPLGNADSRDNTQLAQLLKSHGATQ
jgi:ankyrin repeat protein